MATNSRFKRNKDGDGDEVIIPLKRQNNSNISIDRYSESSLHNQYLDDKSWRELI